MDNPTDDVCFLIRMAAEKGRQANQAKNELDRTLYEQDAIYLNRIAGRLADYERLLRLLRQMLEETN